MKSTATNEQIADGCADLAKALMAAAQKWAENAPGTDGDKIKIVSCAFARIAAENAKIITGGNDPGKATQFLMTALADAFNARIRFEGGESDENESPETFMGKPIVGHC